jgi:hypothetical protein
LVEWRRAGPEGKWFDVFFPKQCLFSKAMIRTARRDNLLIDTARGELSSGRLADISSDRFHLTPRRARSRSNNFKQCCGNGADRLFHGLQIRATRTKDER